MQARQKRGCNLGLILECRLELGQLGSAMARLQAEHEKDQAQLLAAEAAAVQLQESCNHVDSLRAKQTSLADSITLMQSLLEVCACRVCARDRAIPSSSLSCPLVCCSSFWDLSHLHRFSIHLPLLMWVNAY